MTNEMTEAEIQKMENEKAEKTKKLELELTTLKNERDSFLSLIDNKDMANKTKLSQMLKSPYTIDSLIAVVDPDVKDKENYVKKQITQVGFDYMVNKDLQECTAPSILMAFKKILSLGLSYGAEHKEAYLIKGWNTKNRCWEAQFRDGYMAYINSVNKDYGWFPIVNLVLDDDDFEYNMLENAIAKHIPTGNLKNRVATRDKIVGAYIICKNNKNEIVHTSPFFSLDELKERAKQTKKDGTVFYGNVWTSKARSTDFSEMVKKTAIRLWAKTLPKGKTRDVFDLSNENMHIIYGDTHKMETKGEVIGYADYNKNVNNEGL